MNVELLKIVGVLGVCGAASAIGGPAVGQQAPESTQEQEGAPAEVEEVVVTGTFIRRSSFEEVGSPVSVISAEDLANAGPTGHLAGFLRYLPENTGTWSQGNSSASSFSDTLYGGGSINLRGLGSGATLVMLNGTRQTRIPSAADGRVDVNSLVPTIAIERTEILKDGASSLYGTDAVGGVVNFLMRGKFSGAEVRADYQTSTSFTSAYQYKPALIVGGKVDDKLHVVGAVEYMRQTELTNGETGVARANSIVDSSSFCYPGTLGVPTRNADGQPNAASRSRLLARVRISRRKQLVSGGLQ